MRPHRRFGPLLRQFRTAASRTMGEVARALGVTVTYYSDVERGNRPPLTNERIMCVAEFLSIDSTPLLMAAVEERGAIELAVPTDRPKAIETGAVLQRGWADLTDDELIAIDKIVTKKERP